MAIEHNTQRPSSIWLLCQVLYVYRNTLTIRYLRNTSGRAKNQGLFSCKKSGISIGHSLSCHDIVMRFSAHPSLLYVNKNTTHFSLSSIFPNTLIPISPGHHTHRTCRGASMPSCHPGHKKSPWTTIIQKMKVTPRGRTKE